MLTDEALKTAIRKKPILIVLMAKERHEHIRTEDKFLRAWEKLAPQRQMQEIVAMERAIKTYERIKDGRKFK
jgi:hypothetical protein